MMTTHIRAARWMVSKYGYTIEHAKQAIENKPSSVAALYMCLDGYASRKWAEQMIEKSMDHECIYAAIFMVRYCGSDKEWARNFVNKQLKNDKDIL